MTLPMTLPMTLSFSPERIETWPLAKLQPYAKNAKVHGADQVAALIAAALGVDPPEMQKVLEKHARAQIEEFAEIRINF